jgi:hypothetical protein
MEVQKGEKRSPRAGYPRRLSPECDVLLAALKGNISPESSKKD